MKYLYIDFDGVIQIDFEDRHQDDSLHKFNPDCVNNLNTIFKQTQCNGIISSTWRKDSTLTELKLILFRRGFLYPDRIIDITPVFGLSPWCGSFNRDFEIKSDIKYRIQFNDKYCILDDDKSVQPSKFLVRTNEKKGLTLSKTNRAIKILNN